MMNKVRIVIKKAALTLLFIAVIIYVINIFTGSIIGSQPKNTRDTISDNRVALYKLYNDKSLQKNAPQKLALGVMRIMTCAVIGEVCTNNPADAEKNFSKSMLGGMTSMTTAMITHPPSSAIVYAYDSLQKVGFIPKTYAAQGIGMAALEPFKTMWNIFRNISYGILVVIMIALGFMIMMRMKLSAQTAISIENSLPRIVISLLLITFSFAIAGALIDLMYLLMAISISLLLQGAGPSFASHIGEMQNTHLTAGASVIIDSMLPNRTFANFLAQGGQGSAMLGAFKLLLGNLLDTRSVDMIVNVFTLGNSILLLLPGPIRVFVWLLGGLGTLLITSYITSLFGTAGAFDLFSGLSAFTLSFGNLPKPLVGLPFTIILMAVFGFVALPALAGLFIFITILLLFFRIFFILLKAYLMIMLYIIFAPMFMLFEAIPGNKAFSRWFKSLLGEILTFPIVTVLFMLGFIFVNSYTPPDPTDPIANALGITQTFWAPPYLYGLNQGAFVYVVGMGLLFMIPDLISMAKDMLGLKSAGMGNAGLGMFFGGAAAGVGGGLALFSRGAGLLNTFAGSQATKNLMDKWNLKGFFQAPFMRSNKQTSDKTPNTQPPKFGQDLNLPKEKFGQDL